MDQEELAEAMELLDLSSLPLIQVINTNRYGVVTEFLEDHFGRKQGRYTEKNYKGELSSECFYKDDKLHGTQTFYNYNGTVRERINYTDGVLNGLYEKFYDSGAPKKRMSYLSGKIVGRIQTWREDGSVQEDWVYPMEFPF
jgi:antitoxin component YwqK of YwqJK toxin-antitoxin module